ncbi:hypothetical protein CGL27_47145 [Streptomyces sp. 11-1-2]|nr:hypothetical protein CGL27_47145 [Streptomyces sp. 11-1-2]
MLRPVRGTCVVDFTTAWSGPLATRILALLGAEVLKVESASRMDAWRGPADAPTATEFYPNGEPGDRPYNRNAWFNAQNLDKKSVLLDLKTDTGRRQAHDLCRESDLVVTNFTPDTMRRLGLGFDALREINPSVVMVEMSGFGTTGPLRHHRAYGQTMEAMAGITALIGYARGIRTAGVGLRVSRSHGRVGGRGGRRHRAGAPGPHTASAVRRGRSARSGHVLDRRHHPGFRLHGG